MSELYNRIHALCEERGTNITKMSAEAGVSRTTLSGLKSGRIQTLSAQTLTAISRYFGVSVDYLLNTEKVPEEDGDDVRQYLQMLRERPETRMLLDYSKGVDKEDIEAVAEMIRRLRKND